MKLKNVVLASALLGLSVFGASQITTAVADTPAANKIVVIDYQKVIKSSKQYIQTSSSFTEKYKAKSDQLKARNDALSKEDASLVQTRAKLDADLKQGKLSGAALKQREDELNSRIRAFQEKAAKFQQDAQAFEQERQRDEDQQLARIEASIRKIVNDYAAKNGYTLVLDAGAAVYAQPSANITDDVIKLVK